MEYGLGPFNPICCETGWIVLILVVMEYGLGLIYNLKGSHKWEKVLILVVMEYGLGPNVKSQ